MGLCKEVFIAGNFSDQFPVVVGAVAAGGVFINGLAVCRGGGQGAVIADGCTDEITVQLFELIQDNSRLFDSFI